jgi:hypothetical protein
MADKDKKHNALNASRLSVAPMMDGGGFCVISTS